MKKDTRKYLIVCIYWIVISTLVFFTYDGEETMIEKTINFFSFMIGSIVVTLPFSNKLFIRTLNSKKTLSFIINFILMSVFLITIYILISELFFHYNIHGLFSAGKDSSEKITILGRILEGLPGTTAMSFMLCGILLYYEYSSLQKIHLESQLYLLHAQINPHFMFNVLNYIHVLMQKDVNQASDLLLKYSEVLRYQLYYGKKEFVKLEQEILFLKNFIDVEKFRWEDKLDVTSNWNIENGNLEIPPLLFIPFIENAFKHVTRSKENKGYIHISLEQKRKVVSIKVENSKSPAKPVSKNKEGGIGLANIKNRLDILYGNQYSLTFKDMNTVYFTQLTIYV